MVPAVAWFGCIPTPQEVARAHINAHTAVWAHGGHTTKARKMNAKTAKFLRKALRMQEGDFRERGYVINRRTGAVTLHEHCPRYWYKRVKQNYRRCANV